MSRTIRRPIWLAASLVLAVVVGAELAIGWNAAPGLSAATGIGTPLPTPVASTLPQPPAALSQAILARPLFAGSRRLPAPAPEAATAAPPLIAEPSARLVGTIVTTGQRIAFFALPDAKPLALTNGQALQGWQIATIEADRVSLRAADGRVVVRSVSGAPDAPAPVAVSGIEYWHAPPGHHTN